MDEAVGFGSNVLMDWNLEECKVSIFDIAIFTNLTYDHLDFHGTLKIILKQRKIIYKFEPEGIAVLNADDEYFDRLKDATKAKVVTYGIQNDADYHADNIRMGTDGSSFVLRCKEGTFEVTTNLVALYNIYNLLAAVAAMCESGIKVEDMLPYLETLKQIEGRLERIDEGQPFNVFVDFCTYARWNGKSI